MSSIVQILVADDEEIMREFLSEVLASYNPICACDGEEALSILENQEVSLLISDLKMPKLNGLELLKRAKEMNDAIKAIIITGYASLQTESECIQAGADDFLKKPFSIADIRTAVAKALG